MSGLLAYALGGLGLIFIGISESLSTFISPPIFPFPLGLLLAAAVASLALFNSLLSAIDALSRHDPFGVPLQLSSATVASLFLLYSLSAFIASTPRFRLRLPLPDSLLHLLSLFAFSAEFLLFALQRKDTAGIENRYFDLLLVPIAACGAASALSAARPRDPAPRLARSVGLALQGTWFIQMGFSFFSSAIANGCALHERSRGDYTIRCKGHPEYHRGRAVATLQFDLHLASLVVAILGFYAAVVSRRDRGLLGERYLKYTPLSEMQRFDHLPASHFTLVSDEDDEVGVGAHGIENGEITVEGQPLRLVPVSAVNGNAH